MGSKSANSVPDQAIAAIARRQYGIVALTQLLQAGVTPREVTRRVQAGRLHRLHRGVYAVGHRAVSRHGRWLAAVKACGLEGALSHHDAAYLSALLPSPATLGPVHVTVPGSGGRRRREGILVHRSRTITPGDIVVRDGIPTTKPARTLADLKSIFAREQWESAIDRARFLHLPIGDVGEGDPARSRLERAFLGLCRRHRLPLPEVNAKVGRFTVDFLWRGQGLIVETDGYAHHSNRASFERDRARDAELKLMGYDVVRFTYRQVLEEPERVARTLRALIASV
jgi:very-short-patch-repair endonuclease